MSSCHESISLAGTISRLDMMMPREDEKDTMLKEPCEVETMKEVTKQEDKRAPVYNRRPKIRTT